MADRGVAQRKRELRTLFATPCGIVVELSGIEPLTS